MGNGPLVSALAATGHHGTRPLTRSAVTTPTRPTRAASPIRAARTIHIPSHPNALPTALPDLHPPSLQLSTAPLHGDAPAARSPRSRHEKAPVPRKALGLGNVWLASVVQNRLGKPACFSTPFAVCLDRIL